MPHVSDNAAAPFVVFGWDGTIAGVVSAWDNEKEAKDDADARKQVAPEHVDYYYATQDGMRDKVSELTGVAVEALADPSTTLPKAAADEKANPSDKK